ncbi:MAG: SH3 domain-containing protein [Candidatus Zixiibacteriota bacterium]|jgi:hypothetical protein
MNHRWIWLAATICFAFGGAWAANAELKLSTPLSATLKDNYCLHESPDGESEAVICLNAGAELKLVARLKDKVEVEGEEGYWYKAEVMGGACGWVFSAHLDFDTGDSDDGSADGNK